MRSQRNQHALESRAVWWGGGRLLRANLLKSKKKGHYGLGRAGESSRLTRSEAKFKGKRKRGNPGEEKGQGVGSKGEERMCGAGSWTG